MRSIFLPLAFAACATVSSELAPSAQRTLWIDNRTPDALVVRVDGVRVATLLGQQGACIRVPAPGQALTARAVGRTRAYAAPSFIPGSAAGWNWRIMPALGAPGSTLDLVPAEPCRLAAR
ncbi:MAG TPA: hypothetical protein VEX86_01210 [Longimicrobium sp.]|nr:hypothetical protein [Longimicrobium sp.]